ncbi:MAG: HPF/RaiA family ribosome-associated protein [archaeon]
MAETEDLALGGNIRLSGFRDLDHSDMIIVKKLIGNQVKKINSVIPDVTEFSVHLKEVHKIEDSQKYDLSVRLYTKGKHFTAEAIDKNLYVALDNACKKLMCELKD